MGSKYGTVTAEVNLLTTELNSLANDGLCTAGPEITSLATYIYANVKLTLAAIGSSRVGSSCVYVWFIPEVGGTYSDSGESPLGQPDVVLLPATATAAITVIATNVVLPNSSFKAILKNVTGQAFAASNNTLTLEAYNYANP